MRIARRAVRRGADGVCVEAAGAGLDDIASESRCEAGTAQ